MIQCVVFVQQYILVLDIAVITCYNILLVLNLVKLQLTATMNPPRKHPNFGKAHRMNFNKKPKGESYAPAKQDKSNKGKITDGRCKKES